MAGTDPMRPDNLIRQNRALVLELLERCGPASRAQLSKLSGLSQPTVSKIIDYFLERGIVTESGLSNPSVGRKGQLLRVEPDRGYSLGIQVSNRRLSYAVANTAGNIRERGSVEFSTSSRSTGEVTGEDLQQAIVRFTRDILQNTTVVPDRILALGIAVPGLVNAATGEVSMAPSLQWRDVPLKAYLERHVPLPVVVENDINALAYAERLFGVGRRIDNFVLVSGGVGIGAGLIIDGRLFRGFQNMAGEVGYLVIDREQRNLSLEYGCWEQLVDFSTLSSGSESAERMESLRNFALGLADIAVVLAPEAIVIGGVSIENAEEVLEQIRQIMRSIIPFVPDIRMSDLGEQGRELAPVSVAIPIVKEILIGGRSGSPGTS